jgi:hypothetical protein
LTQALEAVVVGIWRGGSIAAFCIYISSLGAREGIVEAIDIVVARVVVPVREVIGCWAGRD